MLGDDPRDRHRQNTITWVGIAVALAGTFLTIGGGVVVLLGSVASAVLGGVSYRQMRRTRRAKPTPRARFRRVKRQTRQRAQRAGRDVLHGKPQGGRREYRAKRAQASGEEPEQPSQPRRGANGKPRKPAARKPRACTARCQQSTKPASTCECSCGGRNHGSAA